MARDLCIFSLQSPISKKYCMHRTCNLVNFACHLLLCWKKMFEGTHRMEAGLRCHFSIYSQLVLHCTCSLLHHCINQPGPAECAERLNTASPCRAQPCWSTKPKCRSRSRICFREAKYAANAPSAGPPLLHAFLLLFQTSP